MGRWLIWVWVWTALLLFWSSAMAQPLQDPLEPTSPSEEASQPELREGPIEEDTQPELSEGPIEEDTQPEPSEGPIEEPEPVEGPLEPGPIEGPIDEEPASGGPVDGADDPCVHTLRGKVLKPEGGSSVEVDDAAVYLRQVGGTASYQTVTDAQGRYTLEGVCPGVYEVEVLATGWDMVLNEYRIPEDGATADWKLSDSTTVIEVRANPYDVPSVRPQETLYGKELDKTRGLDLGEALTAIPGVRTIDMGTISKPVIHGMHSNRVLILFDGIKHEAQSWGLDHAPEIDPFAAHGLTVVKGAAGVRYGSGAIGGVILVHPPTIPRDPGLSGEAHLVGISNGLGGAGSLMLRGGVPQVEGLGWRVQGSIKRVGTLETPDYYLDNTGVEELNVSGAVGFHRSGYGLELSASRFDTTLGVFTGQVAENSNQFRELLERDRPLGEELYRFEYNIDRPYQEVTHTTYMGRGYFDVDVGRVSLQVAHQHNDRQEFDLVRSNVEGPQIDFDLRTLSGELLWEFDAAERWLGGVGLNASRQENIYKGRRLVPNYRTRAAGAFGWAQLLLDGWELEVGARLDSAYVESFQRERVGGDAADIEENQFTFITPSMVAGVLVEPDETWNISPTLG
ncbi:MAG: TonB-dependent receptor plug domain-containing protein [Myxococcota bacterium]